MPEKVYYNQGNVRISTTRATFGGKTYAVNGMTSVRGIVINPNRIGPILLLLGGIFVSGCCGCFGIFPLGAAGEAKVAERGALVFGGIMFFGMALIGLAVAALSIWWLIAQRPTYGVVICTAAGEHQAYLTSDEAEVDDIVAALNEAFIDRG